MSNGQHSFQSPSEAVEGFLARLARPSTLMVAVSGGSDSTGLLIALHRASGSARNHGHRLVAATIDHRLRSESKAEAQAVAKLCQDLSIPHMILRWDGEKPASGISAAAREARYRLLIEAAVTLGADAIVTGHTFEDQMETIAMRAARSTGDGNLGLAGMADTVLLDRRWWLLRPFLATRRAAIRDFLKEQGRGWIDDPTNADRHYERVRVRASLQDEPNAVPETIRARVEWRMRLAQEAADLAARHLRVQHGALACLAPAALSEDAETLRHLLGTLAAILGGRPHLPATATMDRVMAALAGPKPARMSAGRVIFDLRRQGLFLHREARDLPVLHLPSGGHCVWDGRYRLINHSGSELNVGPAPPDRDLAVSMFPDSPPAVALRAMGVVPHMEVAFPGVGVVDKASVIVAPVLGPFDRFLPQFELTLASVLGVLIGCDDFPGPLIKVFKRKS